MFRLVRAGNVVHSFQVPFKAFGMFASLRLGVVDTVLLAFQAPPLRRVMLVLTEVELCPRKFLGSAKQSVEKL